MDKNIISKIIRKYLSGHFPDKTNETVQKWMIKDTYTDEKEQASLNYWNELNVHDDAGTYTALENVNRRIGYSEENSNHLSGQKTEKIKAGVQEITKVVKIPLYKRFSRIAAILILLLIVTGGFFYYRSLNHMIEITVAHGETKHLFLPDSSEIWINAGSAVRYPKKFRDNQRIIHLEGEARFSVTRNERKPFIVQTKQLNITVLGTKFNVKAYSDDEKIITTLTSGKIEVNTHTKESRILKPNEQLTFNRQTLEINVERLLQAETDNNWITGDLIFMNSTLTDIVKTLERRFNITIRNNTSIPDNKQYTIKFLKNESPDEIMDILNDFIGFSYQKNINHYILTPK